MSADEQNLDFFNGLSGRLGVELSEPPVRVSENLLNERAMPGATIEGVSFSLQVFDGGDLRDLTDEEWQRVVFRAPTIRMRGEEGAKVVEHAAPDGKTFTIRDLAAAIAETERQSRGDTDWLGGIDVHHVYFEGLEPEEDGSWVIAWGS